MPSPTPHASLAAVPANTDIVASRILTYEEVSSTNDVALRLGGQGTVIVADRQTAGRGRHGRSWHSPAGLGLWFSVAFEEPLDGLTFAGVLAVRDALRSYAPLDVKWPNDLLAYGKKICGVLVERRQKRSALGIGINVHHRAEDFPEDLRCRATSLAILGAEPLDRGAVLRDVLTHLDRRVMLLYRQGLEPTWREWADACRLDGRRVRWDGMEATVTRIEKDGALVLATPKGAHRLVKGEIAVLDGT